MPFIVANDLQYHYTRHGAGRMIVLLHGFAGSSDSWAALLPFLASKYDVICLDLPGHGLTDAPAEVERYTMPSVAGDIARILDTIGAGSASLLGYSMGGRLALFMALRFPGRVDRLVLESASPGLSEAGARRERVASDERLAGRIMRFGVPAFVAEWERGLIFASQSRLPPAVLDRQRCQRLANSALGLAGSLRGMGAGSQPDLWPELPRLKMPVLLMAGDLDEKYVRINRKMSTQLPLARLEIVPGCGHNVHLEQPEAYLDCVQDWLD